MLEGVHAWMIKHSKQSTLANISNIKIGLLKVSIQYEIVYHFLVILVHLHFHE